MGFKVLAVTNDVGDTKNLVMQEDPSTGNLTQVVTPQTDKATYVFAQSAIVPPATPKDFVNIGNPTGSGVNVWLRKVALSGIASTKGSIAAILERYVAAPTGGSAVAVTGAPLSTDNPSGADLKLVVNTYPATVPSGSATGHGVFGAKRLQLPVAGDAGSPVEWLFGTQGDQAVLLKPGQYASVNFSGAAMPTGTALDWEIECQQETA